MKKGKASNILLVLMLVAGLSILLYPSFSDYWNSTRQTQLITHYAEAVADMDDEAYDVYLNSANEYNEALLNRENWMELNEEQSKRYWQELNFSGDDIMGYIEIPMIDVTLPIYHGTEEEILQIAVGHLEWSSLPVGGESTHAVVSGHRGLPSARLFTDLDRLVVGDYFVINVLNQMITYEIDQIKIVEPYEMDDLRIIEGEDHCTLVTCTPYGVNSHRMLLRGTRIENIEEATVRRVTADAMLIEPIIVAPVLAAPMLLVLLIVLLIPKKKGKWDDTL